MQSQSMSSTGLEQDAGAAPDAVRVYLSYSGRDREPVRRFRRLLLDAGLPVRVFHDMDIPVGEEWDTTLQRELSAAHIVCFFLSPDALGSKYIMGLELPGALERVQVGSTSIVPILLTDCDWPSTPFGRFQLIPRGPRPVTGFKSLTEGLREVVGELTELILAWHERHAPALPPPVDVPPGPLRLRLAMQAVLTQPAEFALLEKLNPADLAAAWRQAGQGNMDPALAARQLEADATLEPPPLWAAWVQTVHRSFLEG